MRLAVITDNPDQPRVYSELQQENVFIEYRIESQSDNTILFEIDLGSIRFLIYRFWII